MRHLLLAASLIALSGCASLQKPDRVPDRLATPLSEWSPYAQALAARDGANPASAWDAFSDALLDALIRDALASDPDLAAARERIAEARALGRADLSRFGPQLSLGSSVQGQRASENSVIPAGRVPGFEAENMVYAAGFDASWELDLWDREDLTAERSEARILAAQVRERGARAALAAEIARSYVQMRGAQAGLAQLEDIRAVQSRLVDGTTIRRDAGEASDLDVERARARLAAYDALRPRYVGEVHRAAVQLAILSGRGAASAASIAERSGDLPSVPDRLAIGNVAAALAARADIRAAEADYVAAARQVDLSALADRPVFSLFGSAGVESVSLDDLLDPESLVGAIGALADWTLLDGGADDAEMDAQTARLRQAEAAYRSAVRDAVLDAEGAAIDLLAARERTVAQTALIQRRARVADMERRRFDAGKGTLLRVDEAGLEVAEARLDVVEARTDQALEFISLIKATAPASLLPDT